MYLIFIPALMDQDPGHGQVQSTVHITVNHVTLLDFHPSLLDQDPDHDQNSQLYTLRHVIVTLATKTR